jgi:hypothetical protein
VGANEQHLENKNLGVDAEQNIATDKLKEELQIMWYKAGLLQISDRERLLNLTENNKLTCLKEINKWNN